MKPIDQYIKFDTIYNMINAALFNNSLPGAFITLQSSGGFYGYFAKDLFKSKEDSEKVDEIALNPNYFFAGEVELLQTLGHEMCHQWQHHYGKPSRSKYHNKEFADKMKLIGLMPSATGKEGGKQTGQNMADYVIKSGPFDKLVKEILSKNKVIDWDYQSWESRELQAMINFSESNITFPSLDNIENGSLIRLGQSIVSIDSLYPDTNQADYHIVSGPEFDSDDIFTDIFIKPPKDRSKNQNKVKYFCPECGVKVWGKADLYIVCGECRIPFSEI